MTRASRLCRSAGLTGYSALCEKLGLNPVRLARDAGVPVAALSDPDLKIPSHSIARALELAARKSRRDDIGLRLAERRRLSNMGAVGLIAREQPNLRKAIEVMVQYQWMQNDTVTIRVEDARDITVIRLGFITEAADVSRQSLELCMGVLARNIQSLLGAGWHPQAVCFMQGRPAHTDAYRRVFGITPMFGQAFNGIVLDRTDLEARIASADPDMARQVARYVQQIKPIRGIVDETEQLVALLLPTGRCTASAVARHLGVDRRTLHRWLTLEGIGFRAILDRQRLATAKSLLADPQRSMASIADQIGLSGPSALSHWYRRHEGCAPRRRLQSADKKGREAMAR